MQPLKAHFLTFSGETKIMKITHSGRAHGQQPYILVNKCQSTILPKRENFELRVVEISSCLVTPLVTSFREGVRWGMGKLILADKPHKISNEPDHMILFEVKENCLMSNSTVKLESLT